MSDHLTGSCYCGGVRFRAAAPFRPVIACHCVQCRKQTGHFMAASAALRANFELIEDRGLKWYASAKDSRRGFCSDCGSTMFFEVIGGDKISFAAGTIDGVSGLTMPAHIYAGEKGDYYDLPADAEVYEGDCSAVLGIKIND